jgi:hypothetical protein
LRTLTLTAGDQIATVSAVSLSNTFLFDPPVDVPAKSVVRFTLSGSSGTIASIPPRLRLAAFSGPLPARGPLVPLGAGLSLIGLMLMPITRRRRIVMAIALLLVLVAGCNNGGSGGVSSRNPNVAPVARSGALLKPLPFSRVTVMDSGATQSVTSTQAIASFSYE